MSPPSALVRDVPSSFAEALVMGESRPLDASMARGQHTAYCTRLEQAGYRLTRLPADEEHPDCLFVEDMAVIVGSTAVITRPGAPSRRGELGPVAGELAKQFPLRWVTEPGTLDGGDVLVSARTVYVGLSSRTNQAGVDQLRGFAGEEGMEVVPIEVKGVLHLKSAVLPIGPETLVVTPGTVDEGLLDRFDVVVEPIEERHRFSALPMADGVVLVTASAPRTADVVARRGFDVEPIDVSMIQAADGGLTCMSILW